MADAIEWGGTPGPWGLMNSGPALRYVVLNHSGENVATTHGQEAQEQDARAIAKVPEMVATLRRIVAAWDANQGPDPYPQLEAEGAPRNRLIADARTILAAIDGEI